MADRSTQLKPLWLWSLLLGTSREFFYAEKCGSACHPFPETWLPSQISFLPLTPPSNRLPPNEPYIKQSQTLVWTTDPSQKRGWGGEGGDSGRIGSGTWGKIWAKVVTIVSNAMDLRAFWGFFVCLFSWSICPHPLFFLRF